MSKERLTLPPHANQLLPSRDRTEPDHHVSTNLDSLSGVDAIIADRLFKRANLGGYGGIHMPDDHPLLITDYLRVRHDNTLTLHPVVLQAVAKQHHNQLLDDIVKAYHDNLVEVNGTLQMLEPSLGVPGDAIKGLNQGLDLAYPYPEFEITPVVDRDCDGRDLRPATDYSIQVHDILADLRSEGIVTNLAKSGCDACGHKAGHELADQLRDEGHTVHGYAGIAASTWPEEPMISLQDFDESSWESGDIVDLVLDSADKHGFRSDIRVQKAGLLRQ